MAYSLSQLFGECPVEILELLAENFENPISRADVARITEMPKSTVNRHFKVLLEKGIVRDTGEKYRKAPLFTINLENEISTYITLLHHTIISGELERKIKDQGEMTFKEQLNLRDTMQKVEPMKECNVPEYGWKLSSNPVNPENWKSEIIEGKYAVPYYA